MNIDDTHNNKSEDDKINLQKTIFSAKTFRKKIMKSISLVVKTN